MATFGFDDLVLEGQEVDRAHRTRRFYLKVQKKQERCDLCGASREKLLGHGRRRHNYRDIPVRNDRILLVIALQRFKCTECKRTFVQRIAGLDLKRSMTIRCLEWIRNSCVNHTFRQIANACGCPERTVRDIAYEHIAEKNRTYRPYMADLLGIDEITLDGRIDNCCCVLVDLKARRPVDVLPNRLLLTVEKWMSSFGQKPRVVTMDMYENYRTAVRGAFPGVPIVADRFHVVRWANKAVDRVRLGISRKDPDVKKTDAWKNNVGLLHCRWGKIARAKRPFFLKWLSQWPALQEVYILKENFYEIYHFADTKEARKALEEWEVSVPNKLRRSFKEVFTAITDWREEFLAYIEWKQTNAYTEGFNSVIRNVNNQGRGYTFEVLKGKLLFGTCIPGKTFRIERARRKVIDFFRKARLAGNPAPKICTECRRPYDEEDSTHVFPQKWLPPKGSMVCSSCRRPLDRRWAVKYAKHVISQEPLEQLKCDLCGEFFSGDRSSSIRIGSGGLITLCHACTSPDIDEEIARELSVSEDEFSTASEEASSTTQSSEPKATWQGFENPDYDALYRNLENARWAMETGLVSKKTKRALGYPIIARDLDRVFRGLPPSDPEYRPKRRKRKDDDAQSSIDLEFEDLKIKFKRPKSYQEKHAPSEPNTNSDKSAGTTHVLPLFPEIQ